MMASSIRNYYAVGRARSGWIMVEMILCLALLGVVLYLAQRQSISQWQSLQMAEQQRQYRETQQQQVLMKRLTGSDRWLSNKNVTSETDYPNCQSCTGDDLVKWFAAAQGVGVNLIER